MSLLLVLCSALAHAQDIVATAPATIEPAARLVEALGAGSALGAGGDVPASTAVRLLLFLTGLSFLPAMVIVMTPFVRFVIVFSLLRQALGLQQSPPNQVIVGLSLFLTLLVMQPVFKTS